MRGNLLTGAGYFFRGLVLLTRPGIRHFVVLPLLANIVLFLVLGGLALDYVGAWIDSAEEALPSWLAFLTWILIPLVWLAGGLLTGYLSTFAVLLLTSPFHALLAEKLEESLTGQRIPSEDGLLSALWQIPRGLFREIRKILYYLPMAALAFLITLIPVLNAFSPLIWFLLGAWMMSLQFVDYPMDNHKLPFNDVKEACAARRLSSLGLGGVVAFISGVPLLNLVVIPAAVAGATLLWCEELRPGRDPI